MDAERISDINLMALQIATSQREGEFEADVYVAVSELIERRKAAGEWKGLVNDVEKALKEIRK